MKRRLYAPAVLLIGLLSAQIVATLHVYLSNMNLLQATETVMRAGYLAVPNARVAAHLDSLTTAMAGGLFFTLSIGAGLSLVTLINAWLWDRIAPIRTQRPSIGIGLPLRPRILLVSTSAFHSSRLCPDSSWESIQGMRLPANGTPQLSTGYTLLSM